MKFNVMFLTLCSIAIGLIIGFSSPSIASPLYIENSLSESHKGDILGLYNSWIKPLKKDEKGYFECESERACTDSVEDVRNGFTHFCTASGGLVSDSSYGSTWECLVNATFIGGIGVYSYGNKILVLYQSVEGRAMEKAAVLELETRKALNGPSGLITTKNGKVFRFLRFGTLSTRIAVEIDLNYSKKTKTKDITTIENVSGIDFPPPDRFYEMNVHLKDGRTVTVSTAGAYGRVTRNYSIGFSQWPLLVLDTENSKFKEEMHSFGVDISSIEFDSENEWKGRTMKEMESLAFYYALSKATNSAELERFIKDYKNNDPDGLLPAVKQKLPAIKAQEAKLALEKAKQDAELNRQKEFEQREVAKNNERLKKTITLFRRTVKTGDDSHCGLVIEVKPPVVKVQAMIGELWLKISQIYPAGVTSCRFINNVYQEPNSLPF